MIESGRYNKNDFYTKEYVKNVIPKKLKTNFIFFSNVQITLLKEMLF